MKNRTFFFLNFRISAFPAVLRDFILLFLDCISVIYTRFDKAVKANPDAHPLFHSDRGFQYTSRDFHRKLEQAGMTQSMSRIAHCIDNGPMEGFWGILKRERYYGRRFTSKQELTQMIVNYIRYYNTRRMQRSLGILTPMEKHELYLAA